MENFGVVQSLRRAHLDVVAYRRGSQSREATIPNSVSRIHRYRAHDWRAIPDCG